MKNVDYFRCFKVVVISELVTFEIHYTLFYSKRCFTVEVFITSKEPHKFDLNKKKVYLAKLEHACSYSHTFMNFFSIIHARTVNK